MAVPSNMATRTSDWPRRRWLGSTLAFGAAAVAAPMTLSPKANAKEAQRPDIVGQMAPSLALDWWIDAHGQPTTFDVDSARGKWVFLKFWQS